MASSDDEEIEWEDVMDDSLDTPMMSETRLDVEEKEEGEPGTLEHHLQSVNWTAINAELAKNDEPPVKKRRRKCLSKDEKVAIIIEHQLHLMTLVAREDNIARCCNRLSLQAAMLSLLPLEIVHPLIEEECSLGRIGILLQWFYSTFKWDTNSAIFDALDDLHDVIFEKRGWDYQLLILFVALGRALGWTIRYTVVLHPRRLCFPPGQAHVVVPTFGRQSNDERREPVRVWSEIYIGEEWIPVDVLRGVLNDPYSMEGLWGRGRAGILPYVVSLEGSHRMIDVTRRYASKWSETQRFRLKYPQSVWWESVLQSFSSSTLTSSCSSTLSEQKSSSRHEEQQLKLAEKMERTSTNDKMILIFEFRIK